MDWLENYRNLRKAARRRPYRQRISKLERYRAEIVRLVREEASMREIQAWLIEQRVKTRSRHSPLASVSTIHAFVRSLPELYDA